MNEIKAIEELIFNEEFLLKRLKESAKNVQHNLNLLKKELFLLKNKEKQKNEQR